MKAPRGWLVDAAVAVGLTVLLLGPALLPGYVLRGDMVFVPHQPWKPAWLGLDGGYPRSVPMDAVVSGLGVLVPGWLVQKVFLVASLVGGGIGAGRVVGRWPAYARAGAVVVFVWNPYVLERLLIGQWALVLGYALLPWVALAAALSARNLKAGWAPLGLVLAASATASPSSGLMAGLVALCVTGAVRARAAAAVSLAVTALVNLSWVVPALFADTAGPDDGSDPFSAFAAREESALGVLPSLLSLGGIWKSSVVPAERTQPVVVAFALALSVAALVAYARGGRDQERARVPGLPLVAGVAVLLAAVPALAPVAAALAETAERFPGLAILRDSHRYVAPLVLVLLPGTAALLTGLVSRARPGREALRLVAGAVIAAPVLLLPSAAWGALGELEAVDYPAEWTEVARLVGEQPDTGATVVLPWTGSYRGFEWNDYRAVLDPAPRFLPGEVLVDDRVLLGDEVLEGETLRTRAVGQALEGADPGAALRELGVRWVLVEKGHRVGAVPEGTVVHDGTGLTLLDLGTSVPASEGTKVASFAVLGADGLIVLFVLCCFFVLVKRPDTIRTSKGGTS